MEYEQAKKMMDDIYQAVKTIQEHEKYICNNIVKEVQMSRCLRDIANLLGLQLSEKPWKCEGMVATEISLVYEDVTFIELENYRKCDEDAGTDREQDVD